MRGSLSFFSAPAEVADVELPRERVTCGSASTDWLTLPASDSAASAAELEWSASGGTWVVTPRREVSLNGVELSTTASLQHGDELTIGKRAFRVSIRPAAPVLNGTESHWIPLQAASTIFGRDTGEDMRDLVRLDAEAANVSRRHLRIEQKGTSHTITDESRTGSTLNGARFETATLILGDRFRVGPYNFEYTGRGARMVSPLIGARILAQGVGVTFGPRTILTGIDLAIEPCSFAGLLGGSGHGKSTLLNVLSGLLTPSTGTVQINGQRVQAHSARELGIGFVPQEDIVHPELTVGEALEFAGRLRLDRAAPGAAIRALARSTAERLGLGGHWNHRISRLSGGQRKRVSIATELLAKPAALFLDEPSSGLDPATEHSLMQLLRRLAESDCTVVASTHVLGRAFLLDQICFLRAGRVVYQGPPSPAPRLFGVETLDEVYLALENDETARAPQPAVAVADLPDAEPVAPPAPQKPSALRAFTTLVARQFRILAADPLNLVFLLAQPLAIGFLIAWVADDAVLRGFLAVISTLWFGTSNGAQQIVREFPVFRRERLSGLGIHSYLSSKLAFLSALTALQACLLLVTAGLITLMFHPYPVSPRDFDMKFMAMNGLGPDDAPASLPVWRMIAFVLDAGLEADDDAPTSIQHIILASATLKIGALIAAAAAGVALGLLISSLAQSTTQSVMWVPLILIPQILLGGVVVTLPEMSASVRSISLIVPSSASQRLLDVANVYGQARPLLANTTRRPQFLSGRKEKVEWSEGSEQFDEPSRHNISWQNLATDMNRTGEHKKEVKETLRGLGVEVPRERMNRVLTYNQVYRDSVDERRDVTIPRSEIFLDARRTLAPFALLAAWIAASYFLAACVLHQRR